tara:strand:- start:7007 stop:7243 length:237 start_codon:yes stop_codon:yes gene_type:complete
MKYNTGELPTADDIFERLSSKVIEDMAIELIREVLKELPNYVELVLDEDWHRRLIAQLADKFYKRFGKYPFEEGGNDK